VGVQTGGAVGGARLPSVHAGTSIEASQMNETMLGGAELGAAMTEEEMAGVVGGDGAFAHMIGFAIGYVPGFAALVLSNAVSNTDLQPYMYGA
jgi:hypothetical protein